MSRPPDLGLVPACRARSVAPQRRRARRRAKPPDRVRVQSFNLLARTTAQENVELPLLYAGVPRDMRVQRARALLRQVGLGDRLGHRPSELSGGQQQRVAIARALANGAPLLMADEPTGNLDSASSVEIMTFVRELNRSEGITVVLVTHDVSIAA